MAKNNHFRKSLSDNNKFGIKGGSFGSVYDVLGVSESCLMMQLPACLVQESGHVYLFDWATSKLVMLHQDWLVWWLAIYLVLIGDI